MFEFEAKEIELEQRLYALERQIYETRGMLVFAVFSLIAAILWFSA